LCWVKTVVFLTLFFFRTLFDKLVREYEKCSQFQDADAELKISKLGEVLVRIITNLGEIKFDSCVVNEHPSCAEGDRELQFRAG